MLPLALDVTRLSVAVVGRGAGALRRLALLDDAGARRVAVFADAPEPALERAAGARLTRRLPCAAELAETAVLFIADLPEPLAASLAATARAAGILVNVEDQTALCDVHVPAIVRRGDLTVAISTGGQAPGLARLLRQWLETIVDARWSERIRVLAQRRRAWRAAGHTPREVSGFTRSLIERQGWLSGRDAA